MHHYRQENGSVWYPFKLVSKQFAADDFKSIYANFSTSIIDLDCGKKCGPQNDRGIPFCCDIGHAVPTAYLTEWDYLRSNTMLWRLWESKQCPETVSLQADTPVNQVLIACLGHSHCQRNFRSITCRAFPFFPYITVGGEFIGMSYYWEYEERCWVISHLQQISSQYRNQFTSIYDKIFERIPQELENFHFYSQLMRKNFNNKRRAIPLLHRNGEAYKITPKSGRMRRVNKETFSKFGPYAIADLLPFPEDD